MNKISKTLIVLPLLMFFLLAARCSTFHTSLRVVDSVTKQPIKGALVTFKDSVFLTDEEGLLTIKDRVEKVYVRAHGYLRTETAVKKSLLGDSLWIELVPFTPKALYLSFYGIGSSILRGSALKLIDETEINSLVIDVKGDRGKIIYKSSIPLATEIGAQKIITVKDIKGLLASLKEKGIYTIARIVVFKDDQLGGAKPELVVKTKEGEAWHDSENLAWVDPFKKEVWEYNISIAVEAAQQGFDEIQFDYVRFPDTNGLVFSKPNTEDNRVAAISGFLAEAKKRLVSYNVFLSADIFGYVFWNLNDTHIGQRLAEIQSNVDYICPMLYPSGFKFGIPGYRDPVANPYKIVSLTLKQAQTRTNLSPLRFRPWIQAFRDYAFDNRSFTGREIREQINASEEFGSHGWMLWNPHNCYSYDGLQKKLQNKIRQGS